MAGELTEHVAAVVAILEEEARTDHAPSLETRRARHELQTARFTPPASRAEVASVEDESVPGPAGEVPVRIYRPMISRQTSVPTLVWLHGGGWTTGNLETADVLAREVCNAGVVVVSVDYRLAPESPFPAGLEDCESVLAWAVSSIDRLGGDPSRLAVGGDSAGGNLAAALAQQALADGVRLGGQLLFYPVVDAELAHDRYPSRRENEAGPILTLADIEWIVDQYLGAGSDKRDHRVSPVYASAMAGLAPAVIVTVELDPLRDEGAHYGQVLSDAGVVVRRHHEAGMPHGVFDLLSAVPRAREVVRASIRDLLEVMPGDGPAAATGEPSRAGLLTN